VSRVFAVANQKGGVGKSTTCVNVSAAFAERGFQVLVVDLDPQAGLTTSFGVQAETLEWTTYQVLVDDLPLEQAIIETRVPSVQLAPANLDLAGAEAELYGEIDWAKKMRRALKPVRDRYDFILLDCPPSLGVLTTNALMAADTVIVALQTEFLAVHGLGMLRKIIQKVQRNRTDHLEIRILRTLCDRRNGHSVEAAQKIQETFGDEVFQTVIHRSVKFADASIEGAPLLQVEPKHPGAEEYRALASEIVGKEIPSYAT